MEVSIVIPTYKRPRLLLRCLTALLAQDYDVREFEIIVVDNAEDPVTRHVLHEWIETVLTRFLLSRQGASSQVQQHVSLAPFEEAAPMEYSFENLAHLSDIPILRYIPAGEACGPAAARNIGWRMAEGEFIAFTDDDCLPTPGWLTHGVNALRAGADGASGRLLVPIPEQPTDYERNAAGLETSPFITANCFYRKSVLEDVGGFDPQFSMAWREDSDLHYTLIEQQRDLVFAPYAVVYHPVRPAPWGVSLAQQRKSQFNALLFKKHPQLYRQNVHPLTPWHYYLSVSALLIAAGGLLLGTPALTAAGLLIWLAFTLGFAFYRLNRTNHSVKHVLEMLTTSALIPPLSIFWRLRGAISHRVFFL
jgi:glycosyltransferase involved in cell wall biosynthesis